MQSRDSFKIGELIIPNRFIAAPMAGVSDQPFRTLCYQFGAGLTFSEMFLANEQIWHTTQSMQKMELPSYSGINAVQIVGSDPCQMASSAEFNVSYGAELIDINMGCPAKKINKKLAGSALLQYPKLVEQILKTVVNAVNVPVTLKIRTGWDYAHKNCIEIAQIAENCGINALTIHGRTRQCFFKGHAEYDSIKKVKKTVGIPVIANGDITTPEQAKAVFEYTNADAIMIGRGAQGYPWIFEDIDYFLKNNQHKTPKNIDEIEQIVLHHIGTLHQFYGEIKGVQIARKHVFWYTHHLDTDSHFRRLFSVIDNAQQQIDTLKAFFNTHKINQKS